MPRQLSGVLIPYNKNCSMLGNSLSHRATDLSGHLSSLPTWNFKGSRKSQDFTEKSALRVSITGNTGNIAARLLNAPQPALHVHSGSFDGG